MNQDGNKPQWWIFGGTGPAEQRLARLPAPPPWRCFDEQTRACRGKRFLPRPEEIDLVNAALYLRRPLLITGKPGVGKTSLTYAVHHHQHHTEGRALPLRCHSPLAGCLAATDGDMRSGRVAGGI